MEIITYDFNKRQFEEIKSKEWGVKWPIVYILSNEKEAYIGETIQCYKRMNEHFHNSNRKKITRVSIIYDKEFNKSAVIDIESFLIRYMIGDGKFLIQNVKNGTLNHNYYNRNHFIEMYKVIWKELKNQKMFNNSLRTIESKDMFKYSPYKELCDRQLLTALDVFRDMKNSKLKTFIIKGGAGTGKSVLAVYMVKLIQYVFSDDFKEEGEYEDSILTDLMYLRNIKNYKVALVVPMKSFRETMKKVFTNVKGLSSSMVITPSQAASGKYDFLIVDEAHRLREKSKYFRFSA